MLLSYGYMYEIPFELPHDKTNKMACAPSEDSDVQSDQSLRSALNG